MVCPLVGLRAVRVALARDITSLKRSQARQAALLAISEAAHDAPSLTGLYQTNSPHCRRAAAGGQFCHSADR